MHRYQPRIHLVQLKAGQKIPTTPTEMQNLKYKTFVSINYLVVCFEIGLSELVFHAS